MQIPPLKGELVDLTLGIYDGAPSYDRLPPCSIRPVLTLESDGLAVSLLALNSHGTTHLDAPSHCVAGGRTVDMLALSTCVGPARVIDLTHKLPGEPVDVRDLIEHSDIVVPGSRVLLNLGWDKVFPDRRYYTDHPHITPGLAQWLAARQIALLGLDIPTPNLNAVIDVHRILLGAGIVVVESLAHLERLPATPFLLIAAPLLVLGGDGAPVRAMAIV